MLMIPPAGHSEPRRRLGWLAPLLSAAAVLALAGAFYIMRQNDADQHAPAPTTTFIMSRIIPA